jgi:nicotinamidase-related amidase
VSASATSRERKFFSLSRTFMPPITLNRERLALVIVDMQYLDASADCGFGAAMEVIEPGSMTYFNERNETQVVPGIARLVEGFRTRGLPIIYVLVGSDYRDLRDLPSRHRTWIRTIEGESGVEDILWSGNPAYRVRDEFPPRPEDTIIKKTAFGAFTSSTMDETLRSMAIDQLLVTGIATNCCVSTTVRDATDLGYSVVVVEECTADYDRVTHETAMKGLYFNFARVVLTVDDALAAVDAQATV